MTQRKAFFAAGLATLIASSALAQASAEGTPTRIRGTVEKLDGKTLSLKTRDGQTATVSLADNFAVSALAKKTLGDVKANDYIASTGIRGTDGKLHCVELRVFPEALRGTAEGQFPWDLMPDSTMTNATVTGITTASDGHTFRVKYKDKESEFVAGPDCQVFAYVPGDPALLKPGAAVFMVAQKKPDGGLSAGRVTAEKDGVKPPM